MSNAWWSISHDSLRAMLMRVASGEDVDLVLMEEYANSEIEQVEGNDE